MSTAVRPSDDALAGLPEFDYEPRYRDWDGLRTLISADARLRVANCYAGRVAGAPYLMEYERATIRWRMALTVACTTCAPIFIR